MELSGKGVERSHIDEVLASQEQEGRDGATEGGTEAADALERTVRRRFSSQFVSDPDAAERRLAGFLARRGYDWDTIGRMARMLTSRGVVTDPNHLGVP